MSWINKKETEPELSAQASAWLFCNKVSIEDCKTVKGIMHLSTNLGPLIYQPAKDEIAKYSINAHEWIVLYPHLKRCVQPIDLFNSNEMETVTCK